VTDDVAVASSRFFLDLELPPALSRLSLSVVIRAILRQSEVKP
jgi:hypothetical protein